MKANYKFESSEGLPLEIDSLTTWNFHLFTLVFVLMSRLRVLLWTGQALFMDGKIFYDIKTLLLY